MAKLSRKQIKEGLNSIPMEGLLYGAAAGKAAEAKLTHKQREFARMVALGESKAGAYRQAYKSKGTPKTQAANGYKLARRTDIEQTTQAFKEAQLFAESHTPAQLRAFVIQQLTKHASNEDNSARDQLAALKLLGTVAEVGAFVDRKEVVQVQSSQTVRDRIMAKLEQIGRTVEAEAQTVATDSADADSLLAELAAAPPPDENQENDTHGTPTPEKTASQGAEHTHIIPHNRTADQHNRTASIPNDSSSDVEYNVVDAYWEDSASIDSMSDSTQSGHPQWVGDSGLPPENVTSETMVPTELSPNK